MPTFVYKPGDPNPVDITAFTTHIENCVECQKGQHGLPFTCKEGQRLADDVSRMLPEFFYTPEEREAEKRRREQDEQSHEE